MRRQGADGKPSVAAKVESFPSLAGEAGRVSAPKDTPKFIEANSGEPILLPSGVFLTDASYLQQGDDLVLIGPDGTVFVVRGYFLLDNPPDLISPEGGRMTAALVQSFTPPEAAGQYAQLGDQLAQAAQPIGQVKDLTGQAFAVRADGTRVALSAGDPVYQGDVIETGAGAAINLLFVDETTFALGDQARLALDEMVYNPASQQGSSSFSILKGVFVFVSGQVAATDNTKMTVTTPVATIGIRGTKVAGDVKPPGEETKFTVIDGEIAVITQGGTVVMSDQNATTTVTSFLSAPSAPVILSQAEVNASYGSVSSISGGLGAPSQAGPGQEGGEGTGEGGAGGEGTGEGAAEGEGAQEAAAEGEGEAEGEAEGEGAAEGEGEAEGEAEGRALAAGESEGDGEGDSEGDAEGDAEGEGVAEVSPEAGGEGDAEGGEGDGEGDGEGGTEPEDPIDPTIDVVTPEPEPEPEPDFGGGLAQEASEGGGEDPGGGGGTDDDGGPIFVPEDDPEDEIIIVEDIDEGTDDDPIFFISGTAGDDNLSPASGNEVFRHVINGGGGNDTITGGNRDDTLIDGTGFDSLNGGLGDDLFLATADLSSDTFSGGSGSDTVDFSNFGDTALTVNLSGATATTNPGTSTVTDFLFNIENVIGGDGDDQITGNSNANILTGGAGDDILIGGSGLGDDTYIGGTGTDTVSYASATSAITVNLASGTASGVDIGRVWVWYGKYKSLI